MHRSAVAAIVLYQMVNLYRRRPSKQHNRAAHRLLRELIQVYQELDAGGAIKWLAPKIVYQEAYLSFLNEARCDTAVRRFLSSAEQERCVGRAMPAAISTAQALVVELRRGSRVTERLARVRDALANADTADELRWLNENLPIHQAAANLAEGRFESARSMVDNLAVADESLARGSRQAKARYIAGIAAFQMGDRGTGLELVSAARRAYWTTTKAEGRAAVCTTLGDMWLCVGERDNAVDRFREALAQPAHMDNQAAQDVARQRLAQLEVSARINLHGVFHPWVAT